MADRPFRRQSLVLVVDDDAAIRDSLGAMLNAHDFLVSAASNAGEAILELGAQRPDVILTDIHMPLGDGYELLEALRRFREPVPVIAMTGQQRQFGVDYLGMAQRLGAVAVVDKIQLGDRVVDLINRAIADAAAIP